MGTTTLQTKDWTLGDLAAAAGFAVAGWARTPIRDVQEDSRLCRPGDLFVAIPGTREDGLCYARDAVARGAVAVAAERDPGLDVPWIGVPSARRAAGVLADLVHGDPSRRIALVGVTGTNGKTTTAFLGAQLVPGPAGFIGTTGIRYPGVSVDSANTTPGATDFRRHLRRMVEAGCSACFAEISSHALDQGRVDGLRFAAAVYTNLTGDHLDYHGTMERYAAAKARLFEGLDESATAVLNASEPACERISTRARVVRYRPTAVRVQEDGTRFRWRGRSVRIPFVGRHNAANAAAALEAACAIGADPEEAIAVLDRALPARGRLEAVQTRPFLVLVDYAHTDDALEKALAAVREVARGAVTVVFGCGGDRDRTKRPRMGAVAGKRADRIVVTSDNPRTEDPGAIAAEILSGIPPGRARVVLDRRSAIREAIRAARPGDAVLIAGKGHETYQIVGASRAPFDDLSVAREELAAYQI